MKKVHRRTFANFQTFMCFKAFVYKENEMKKKCKWNEMKKKMKWKKIGKREAVLKSTLKYNIFTGMPLYDVSTWELLSAIACIDPHITRLFTVTATGLTLFSIHIYMHIVWF